MIAVKRWRLAGYCVQANYIPACYAILDMEKTQRFNKRKKIS